MGKAESTGDNVSMPSDETLVERVAGNALLIQEYCAYLRIEKGMRPATCEAYHRDLEQFAEQVERGDRLLLTAVQTR